MPKESVAVKKIRLTTEDLYETLISMSQASVLQAARKRGKLAEAIKKKRGFVEGQISLRDAAKQAGVDVNALYRAQNGKAVTLENMLAIETWAGVK